MKRWCIFEKQVETVWLRSWEKKWTDIYKLKISGTEPGNKELSTITPRLNDALNRQELLVLQL